MASPKTPKTPNSPSSPSMSPGKLKIFFQDLRRGSRQKFGNQKARVAQFFGNSTNRCKIDQETIPILELAENELHEARYGATTVLEKEVCQPAASATKTDQRSVIVQNSPWCKAQYNVRCVKSWIQVRKWMWNWIDFESELYYFQETEITDPVNIIFGTMEIFCEYVHWKNHNHQVLFICRDYTNVKSLCELLQEIQIMNKCFMIDFRISFNNKGEIFTSEAGRLGALPPPLPLSRKSLVLMPVCMLESLVA